MVLPRWLPQWHPQDAKRLILRHVNRKTDPKKTEYEKETKETMETEQKVIVLRTEYCTDCGKNKGMI